MSRRAILFPFLAFALAAACQAGSAPPEQQPAAKPVALVVPHTHWEGAVFKTRDEYLDIGLPHILKALYLLKKYPDYRFVLDQMCYVKPFLERYPAEAPAFRKFLAEGRLQIGGGTDTMHDNNMPSGESIVRQYLFGKQYFRRKLGYEVTTGWGLDTFGHNGQMPQILRLAGMQSYWFQRGVPGNDTPSEFLWQGIDGTQIPAFWLPISYGALHNIPRNPAQFVRLVQSQFDRLAPYRGGNERVLMAGADVWEPEEELPQMVELCGRSAETPLLVRFALPADFEALVAKRGGRPVVAGELNPVFQGIYSSRIEVKQTMRNLERLLTTAEKLAVIAGWLGAPAARDSLERAWEPVLFNQAHDLASGVMVDKVYEDSMLGFNYSNRLADETIQSWLDAIAQRVGTEGPGVPVAVFNALAWPRTDVVVADIGFSEPGVETFGLTDPAGDPVPVQFLGAQRNADNGIRQARVAFIARDVPSMGYSVYRAVPNLKTVPPAPAGLPAAPYSSSYEDRGAMENEFYRATFNLWTGELTSLVLKESQWEVLSAPANVVAREHDGGDFWELYGTLNGARLTAMQKEIPPPRPAYTQFSSDFVGGSGAVRGGPVFSEFRISHPFGKNQFSTRVRMYRGLRRIDIGTEILNQEEFVRYRVLFPTSIRNGRGVHEIPFGAIERPSRHEFPAQNWIDYGDGAKGLALLNRGLPGNNVADGTLMLSLMRSARLISYGYSGGYEPGVGSDTGLGVGKRYGFEYAILPHAGDWRDSAAWRAGLEFNNPLIARTLDRHTGDLGSRWGLLEAFPANVVVSALKPGPEDSAILRVYEAAGKKTAGARVAVNAALRQVTEVNLIEDALREVRSDNRGFSFDLRPYEIRTFKLNLTQRPASRTARAATP